MEAEDTVPDDEAEPDDDAGLEPEADTVDEAGLLEDWDWDADGDALDASVAFPTRPIPNARVDAPSKAHCRPPMR